MAETERVFSFEKLASADLIVDAVYQSGSSELSGEPLSKLLPCGNMGGFRVLGSWTDPRAVVLFTTLEEDAWPDFFDISRGLLHYYGDNRSPARQTLPSRVAMSVLSRALSISPQQNSHSTT